MDLFDDTYGGTIADKTCIITHCRRLLIRTSVPQQVTYFLSNLCSLDLTVVIRSE